MGQFMREGRNQTIRTLQLRCGVGDLNAISIDTKRSNRVLLWLNHPHRWDRGSSQRIVIGNQIDFPVRHSAIGPYLIEETQGECVALLAIELEESRSRQHETRFCEAVLA